MRRVFICVLALLALFSLGGCGGADVVPRDNSGVKVGVAMPSEVLQRWNQDGANLEMELRAKDFDVDVQFADYDAARQAAQIAHMIDRGCKVLIVAAVDSDALAPVLERAKGEGVTIIAYDRLLMNTDAVDYYATFDSAAIGRMQAEAIVAGLRAADAKEPLRLEIAAGPMNDSNTAALFAGAMDVLRPYIDSGRIVVPSGDVSAAQCATPGWASLMARERMAALLARCYTDTRPDAVLCANDSIALGVLEALKNDGYGTPERPLPLITGQDADVPNVRAIIAGEQTMTVFKDTRRLAAETARMVEAIARDESPAIGSTKEFDNGKKPVPAHVLTGACVDAANYKELLIDSGYYSPGDVE